jgi:hypothetical protein
LETQAPRKSEIDGKGKHQRDGPIPPWTPALEGTRDEPEQERGGQYKTQALEKNHAQDERERQDAHLGPTRGELRIVWGRPPSFQGIPCQKASGNEQAGGDEIWKKTRADAVVARPEVNREAAHENKHSESDSGERNDDLYPVWTLLAWVGKHEKEVLIS